MAMKLSNEQLEQATAAFAETGSNTKAGLKLGIGERDMRYRLQAARARGIGSTLYGPDGEVKLQWVKNDKQRFDPAKFIKEMMKACQGVKVPERHIIATVDVEDNLTFYPWPDLHIGMLSWEPETGRSWDLPLAEKHINLMADKVAQRSPPSRWAMLLGLGDLLHADNQNNETEKSHNPLDVDGRYPKIYGATCRLLVMQVDRLLLYHEGVTVRILKGNHDPHSSVGLAYYLAAWFRNEPRVTIDLSPDPFWFMKFGKTMLAATHGDQARAAEMAMIMATRRPKVWGSTTKRYAHLGHWHRAEKIMIDGGCITEIHEAPMPKDGWSHAKGFLSGSSLKSITYGRDEGEIERHTVWL